MESWLPIGFELPDGARCGRVLHGGSRWQIVETRGGGSALIATEELFAKWEDAGLVEPGELKPFSFGSDSLREVSCGGSQMLAPLTDCRSPENKSEALAFATAFRETRAIDPDSPLQDAVYVEKFSRLLPAYGITSKTDDDLVLGYWLTGGATVSAKSFRRLRQMLSWLGSKHLCEVLQTAGFQVSEVMPLDIGNAESFQESSAAEAKCKTGREAPSDGDSPVSERKPFELAGRSELEEFFNEHVIDIILHKERYAALSVGFPSAVVLHGPPGCGKTFAVEQLVEYLGWPSFKIDASSIASPYIHETSKKVAEVFEKAMQNAPSVLVIDEMEAFLADRETGGGSSHHRIEEVAEFLRRIPEAAKNEVLIVAMTNRIEMIDSAIMRRGRFDHVIKVDYASPDEVLALLDKLLVSLPKDDTVQAAPLAKRLAGRPLSDVAFVVREGARLAARSGAGSLSQEFLLAALDDAPPRSEDGSNRRVGFV